LITSLLWLISLISWEFTSLFGFYVSLRWDQSKWPNTRFDFVWLLPISWHCRRSALPNLWYHHTSSCQIRNMTTYGHARYGIWPPMVMLDSWYDHLWSCQICDMTTYGHVKFVIWPPKVMSDSWYDHLRSC